MRLAKGVAEDKNKKEVSDGYIRKGVWYGLRKLMEFVKGIVK